ncbi:MAG: hypothetical protein KC609_00870 [Myxococcales bacterium]|nr:hypothetical protein [Myxococcales bacterium]
MKKGDETLVATSVAVVTKRRRFRMRTLEITKPAEAGSTALLLRGLLPDIFVGTGSVNALAHDADHNGAPDAGTVVPLIANGDGTFQPIDWTAQLLGRTITFYDMSLSLDLSGAVPVLRFSGKLERSQLSLFIISLGGIDQFSVDGILNTIFLDPIEEPGRTLYPIEAELTGE